MTKKQFVTSKIHFYDTNDTPSSIKINKFIYFKKILYNVNKKLFS